MPIKQRVFSGSWCNNQEPGGGFEWTKTRNYLCICIICFCFPYLQRRDNLTIELSMKDGEYHWCENNNVNNDDNNTDDQKPPQQSHRPRSLHIGKRISVIFSMVSIEGWNKSWAPILAGGKADRHWISLPCLLYSCREKAVSIISGHCEMTGNTTNVVSWHLTF